MKQSSFWFAFLFSICITLSLGTVGFGMGNGWLGNGLFTSREVSQFSTILDISHSANSPVSTLTQINDAPDSADGNGESAEATGGETPDDDTGLQDFETAITQTEQETGLFSLYHNLEKNQLYAEVRPDQLNRNFFLVSTVGAGLGEFGLYRGMPLRDFPFVLRRLQNTVQVVVPNVYFRSRLGDINQRFVDEFFSDSVVATLPLLSIHPERQSLLVDLAPLLTQSSPTLADLSSLSGLLGYGLNSSNSYIDTLAAFPLNLEFEVFYNFANQGADPLLGLLSLPDGSSFNLGVHYSLSELPQDNGYRPRPADERIGYFVTAYQDISERRSRDRFVRYINRWHLEKQDPSAEVSPPQEPLVFWIENTVPLEYREAVRQGILMWNTAFEKIGFKEAIQVRQMPDDADWDPADIRYNTVRWTDSWDGGVALGPSRANPFTGEILDADVLVDANFMRTSHQNYRILVDDPPLSPLEWYRLTQNPNICTAQMGLPYLQDSQFRQAFRAATAMEAPQGIDRCYSLEANQQLTIGATTLSLLHNTLSSDPEMERYLNQFLAHVIAHEIGHVLGLRHNFEASTLLRPEQLNDVSLTQEQGLANSVMDYLPPNLAPPELEQGDYYSTTIGAYDQWAIEYGYSSFDDLSPLAERRALQAIAQRAPEPELAYATDEDVWSGIDPYVNTFDLSDDSFTYSQWQMELAQRLWTKLEQRFPGPGQSYDEVRPIFNRILNYYFSQAANLTSYIGGRSFNRYHQGDAPDRLPLEPVSVAEQRQALAILQQQMLQADAFNFPPQFGGPAPPAPVAPLGFDGGAG
jgi:hypothetical protein